MINMTSNNRLFKILHLVDSQFGKKNKRNIMIKDVFDSFYIKNKAQVERSDYERIRKNLVNFPTEREEYEILRNDIKRLIVPVSRRMKNRQKWFIEARNNAIEA